MLIKEFKKNVSITLAICFISAYYALPALAMPQRQDQDQTYPQKTKQSQTKRPQPSSSHNTRPTTSGSQGKQKAPNKPSLNSQETKRTTTIKKPDSNKQDYQRPDPHKQDYKRPDPNKQDYQRPDPNKQDYQRPDPHKQDYKRPDSNKQDYQRPDPHKQDYKRPDPHKQDYKRPNPHKHNNMPRIFAPGPRYEHHRSYPHWRKSNIVFHFPGPRDHFWWGSRHNLSLGEFLIITMIVQSRPSLTTEEVYLMHTDGYSYETICYNYGLGWHRINYNARLKYRKMHTYSIDQGVPFWGWDDTLGY